jgi:hypothetical protein
MNRNRVLQDISQNASASSRYLSRGDCSSILFASTGEKQKGFGKGETAFLKSPVQMESRMDRNKTSAERIYLFAARSSVGQEADPPYHLRQ